MLHHSHLSRTQTGIPRCLPVFISSIPTGICLVFGIFSLLAAFVFGGIGVTYLVDSSSFTLVPDGRTIQTFEIAVCFVSSLIFFICAWINAINDKERLSWRKLSNRADCGIRSDRGNPDDTHVGIWKWVFLFLVVSSPVHAYAEEECSSNLLATVAAIALSAVFYGLIKRKKVAAELSTLGFLCHLFAFSIKFAFGQMSV